MKKLLVALLCLLLFGLWACVQTPLEEISTTDITITIVATTEHTENVMENTLVTTTTSQTSENDPIAEVLRSYPIEFMGSHFQEFTRYYALHTINGNEVLMLGVKERDTIFLDVVYVIRDGIAVQQRQVMWGGGLRWDSFPPVLFENETIRLGRDSEGVLVFHYYRFEDGELKPQIRLTDSFGDYYLYPTQGSRIDITREEFEQRKQEMEGNGQTIEIDWQPLAEFGR